MAGHPHRQLLVAGPICFCRHSCPGASRGADLRSDRRVTACFTGL